jgi:HAD superfamily hydrolase (TIGR01509 family)
MEKVVVFDWGGVIMHKHPVDNNDRQAIVRTIKSFNPSLTDEEAWDVYFETLPDENGIYISRQDDEQSKVKWIERLNSKGNLNTTVEEFSQKFTEEYLKVDYYKDLVEYIYSLKEKCKIAIFSDLIYCCYPALDGQVDLSKFDYVWLSYIIHERKNSEKAFQIVEEGMQVSPENILFIDDTLTNIENAKSRGWNTCQAQGYELDRIKESVDKFLNNK